jgi:hypothetical protein
MNVLAVEGQHAGDLRVPGMRSFMRLMHRKNVLLPQPDGPMSAVTWNFSKSRLTWCRAWNAP